MPLWHARLRTDQRGNVAIMFGLSLLPVLAMTGAAIDYSQASLVRARLQAATDATALRLCQLPKATADADIRSKALTWMKSYMASDAVTLPDKDFKIASDPRQIEMRSLVPSTTYFGRIYKYFGATPFESAMPVSASARCAAPVPQDFEIALVLDTTGSMDRADKGGVSKMEALRKAAKDFLDFVASNPSFSTNTRIAIVPFASAVALDATTTDGAAWVDRDAKSSLHWTNFDVDKTIFKSRLEIFDSLKKKYSSWRWGGCFESLPYPLNVSDGGFDASKGDSYYVPMLAPDEPGTAQDAVATGYASGKKSTYSSYYRAYVQYSYNSYLGDKTNANNCQGDPGDAVTAEKRLCKYVSPSDTYFRAAAGTTVANGPNYGCTSQPMLRLTTDMTALRNKIDSLTANGATNIQEGLIWGWRALSPNSVLADGVSYTKPNSRKILILMTDGFNSWNDNPYNPYSINQSFYSSFGFFVNANDTKASDGTATSRFPATIANPTDSDSARAAMDTLTKTTCDNIAKLPAPIETFTIGFSIDSDKIDQKGIDLLAGCASKPTNTHAFVANDSTALVSAFRQIATSIGALRLTQ
ncbi:pilus assembly protein [Methylobacterium segetis]|uniref:pilus assembly protein n=1 Tax=Methylobacterium segetis TaxID=2488750 RepID=UPI0010483126|nr:pilus assembly protein [Methylobacterium segetis]